MKGERLVARPERRRAGTPDGVGLRGAGVGAGIRVPPAAQGHRRPGATLPPLVGAVPGRGGTTRGWLGAVLLALAASGCAVPRVVPVPAAGVTLDPAAQTAAAEAEGVRLVVRPSAWRGSPSYLPSYVTPFHVLLVNGSPAPVAYEYGDLRLFDEARFQYTALPPAEVARILRYARGPGAEVRLAAAEAVALPFHRRRPLFWDPWWWDPWWWPPALYPVSPPVDDVLTQALPVGPLQPGARTQGFVYFPRLRREATRVSFEFHFRLGATPQVLTLPFAVERAGGAAVVVAAGR